jgi:2',3'-cyclic-nucleotide 2'-phosphodiesterase (5'-nucleotidase family)
MKEKILLIGAASILLAACDGDDGVAGQNGQDGFNSLVSQTSLNFGDPNCRFGGVRIDSGLDANSNSILDASEVNDTSTVCNADTTFQLQLLHFSDINSERDIIDNAPRFSAILDNFRNIIPNTVVLSAGGNWRFGQAYVAATNDVFTNILGVPGRGRAHIAYLNEMGVQASAFGTTEFNLGTAEVASILAVEGAFAGAQFPYLSANLNFEQNNDLSPLVGPNGATNTSSSNAISASTVISVNGELVGIVGATTPFLNTLSSPEGVSVLPEDANDVDALATIIQSHVDELTAQGINKVILLASLRLSAETIALTERLNDVDIVVDGGANTLLADSDDRLRDGDTPEGNYPTSVVSASGEPTLIVSTDGDYTYLGRLVVNFDENGQIIPQLMETTINGAYASDIQGLNENNLTIDDAIPRVAEISTALSQTIAGNSSNVFGQTDVYLNGESTAIRTEETNLGNLIAEANLEYARQIDPTVTISMQHGARISSSIGQCTSTVLANGDIERVCLPPAGIPEISQQGQISQLDIELALGLNDELALVDVTGAQLKALMEHAVSQAELGAASNRFAQIGGFRFSFDPSETAQTVDTTGPTPIVATSGTRVRSALIINSNMPGVGSIALVQNGVVNPDFADQVFRLVTLRSLVEGEASYPIPRTNIVFLDDNISRSGNAIFANDGTEQDAFAEYLLNNFPADDNPATRAIGDNNSGIEIDSPAEADSRIQDLSKTPFDDIFT